MRPKYCSWKLAEPQDNVTYKKSSLAVIKHPAALVMNCGTGLRRESINFEENTEEKNQLVYIRIDLWGTRYSTAS